MTSEDPPLAIPPAAAPKPQDPIESPPTLAHLDELLRKSIQHIHDDHKKLIEWQVYEIDLCHHLAVYLGKQPTLTDWDIDIEYNRQNDEAQAKALKGLDPSAFGRKTERVRPDLIIHKRGSKGPNLLVVEAKRAFDPDQDTEMAFAKRKLELFLSSPAFQYTHGALISFTDREPVLWAPDFTTLAP